ncbi:MAG: hypothetical protein ACRC6I_10960 [Paracoccaceae bacterium]
MDITQSHSHPASSGRPLHEKLGLLLGTAVLVLVALHAFVMTCWSGAYCSMVQGPVDTFGYLFDLSREKNVPAWFSVVLLMLVAVGAAVIWAVQGARPWFWLAVLFTYMSLDEATDLHGLWPMAFDLYGVTDSQFSRFMWVVPGAVFVFVIAALFLRWVLSLPRRTMWYFVVAGAVFVTGGIGFEVVGSLVARADYFNPAYLVASTLEEALEMAGVVIMLMGLAAHAETIGLRVTV